MPSLYCAVLAALRCGKLPQGVITQGVPDGPACLASWGLSSCSTILCWQVEQVQQLDSSTVSAMFQMQAGWCSNSDVCMPVRSQITEYIIAVPESGCSKGIEYHKQRVPLLLGCTCCLCDIHNSIINAIKQKKPLRAIIAT